MVVCCGEVCTLDTNKQTKDKLTMICLMPKYYGKSDEQNLKFSIQVFTCYEAKQQHIPKDGVACRQVDKTSG